MARGELDISHAAFERLPATRAVGYLRDLLAALDVIPPYQAALERITPWLLTCSPTCRTRTPTSSAASPAGNYSDGFDC